MKILFDREYSAMKMHFFVKSKKNKKLLAQAKMFEGDIDREVRDLLVDEFFSNVCRQYARLQLLIYDSTRKIVNEMRE